MFCMCVLVYLCILASARIPSTRFWLTTCLSRCGCYTTRVKSMMVRDVNQELLANLYALVR
jgi:hypothetical protein